MIFLFYYSSNHHSQEPPPESKKGKETLCPQENLPSWRTGWEFHFQAHSTEPEMTWQPQFKVHSHYSPRMVMMQSPVFIKHSTYSPNFPFPLAHLGIWLLWSTSSRQKWHKSFLSHNTGQVVCKSTHPFPCPMKRAGLVPQIKGPLCSYPCLWTSHTGH